MTLKSKWLIGGISAVLIVAFAFVYEVVLPNKYAAAYKNDMQKNAKELDAALWNVSNTLSLPFFTGGNMTPEECLADLDKIKSEITKNKAVVDTYKAGAELKQLPLSGYTSSYKEAKELRRESEMMAKEIKKRLAKYENLINYSVATNKVNKQQLSAITDFSKISAGVDTATLLAGIQNNAKACRDAAEAYSRIKAPAEIAEDHATFVQLNFKIAVCVSLCHA